MCLPLKDDNRVIAHEAPRALHRAAALFMLIMQVALADYLRPDISFTPGLPVEVAPVPSDGATSAPPFTYPVWRPR
jgi:hypothetical protein